MSRHALAPLRGIAAVLLLLAAQSVFAGSYHLLADAPGFQAPADDNLMLPADGAVALVIDGLPPNRDAVQVRVVSDGKVLAKQTLSPRNGQLALSFQPEAGTLKQLDGLWHVFSFRPPSDAPVRSVTVAGSFNGWSTNAQPMTDRGDGVYRAMVQLEEGAHHYKFVVNGDRWLPDPNSNREFEEDDNYGGVNSGLFVGFDARRFPAPRPNYVAPELVRHDPATSADRSVASPRLLRLSVRAQHDDVERAAVWHREGDGAWQRQALLRGESLLGFDRFGTVIQPAEGPVAYVFELADGNDTLYLAGGKTFAAREEAEASAYDSALEPAFHTPDWAKHAVWYQVFPERFRNGDTSNDPDGTQRWQSDWWASLPGEGGPDNRYKGSGDVWNRRYGGDMQGAIEALPYLKRLGVTAIYFNPVFEGESLHKYDATDYRHIDDNFGVKGDLAQLKGETEDPATWQWTPSDRVFLHFIEEAHRQGFKVIIDGVFNHVGRAHYAFQDVLKNGRNSPYAEWFAITDWGTGGKPGEPGGIQWVAWDGPSGHLPAFRKDESLGLAPGPREHVFNVTRRWMAPDGDPSKGIDGWRLDVPGDIPHPFWKDWRKLVKSINPDAYISGEIWSWAQPWLEGDEFDAVMNYQFAMPAQDFFVDRRTATTPSQFAGALYRVVNAYPLPVVLVQQNLMDSHDTDRLASMFVNPDRPYDGANRLQDNGPDYSHAKPTPEQWQRMKQLVVCQMTFVGAPMIYYGDEAGMWSPDDPANRQPMLWPDLMPYDDPQVVFDADLFAHYQRLIALREQSEALQLGDFRVLAADDGAGVLVYARQLNDKCVYVALNRSARARTVSVPVDGGDDATPLIDWLDPKQASLSLDDDGRPVVKAEQNAAALRPVAGVLKVELAPYGSAVLAGPDALDR